MMLRNIVAVTTLIAALAGCCTQKAIHVTTCIEKPGIVGLCETEPFDKALKLVALGLPYQGKLSEGQEYVVTKPLVVYRVWDKSKDYSQYGSWWTFEKPEGPIENWRHKYVVCSDPEWGAHDVFSKCQLKIGTKIVVGPGQSITCKNETIQSSAANQIFIPNKVVNDDVYVESCEKNSWP